MASSFPTTLDVWPGSGNVVDLEDAIEKLEVKVGVNGSAVTSSLDYRVGALEGGGGGTAKVDVDASTAALTTTATKTANYTAAAGEWVPVNSTAGAVTITLPTAPADGTRVAVQAVATGTNPIVIVSGGADLIDQSVVPPGNAFGDTTHYRINAGRTPSDGQVAILKYDATTDTWFARDSLLSETVVHRRKVVGDAFDRYQLIADGTVLRGDGTAAPTQAALITQAAYVVEGVGGKHAITAYGLHAAEKTRNVGSTAFGYYALYQNNPGDGCVAVGYEAMRLATAAADVTAVGFQAFRSLQTAAGGTAVGCQALYQCTTGHYNTGVGVFAFAALTTGHDNTGIGTSVFQFVTSGGDNVGVGYEAGTPVTVANKTTTGSRQVLVGRNTGQSTTTQLNDILALGHGALCGGNNAVAIGSGVLAGAAGAVAIGRDNAGTSATTSTANDFVLGTALHNVKVPGHLLIAAGSSGAPGIAFAGDTNTGIYQASTDRMDFVVNGGGIFAMFTADAEWYTNLRPGTDGTGEIGTSTKRWLQAQFTKGVAEWGHATLASQPAAIANADGTLADITTKFNSVLAVLRNKGSIAP